MSPVGRVATVILLAAAASLVKVHPAHAGVLDVTCTPPSSTSTTFSPPLTNSPQTVTLTASRQFGPCESLSQPALTSGVSTGSFTLVTDCVDVLGAGTVTFTITWNTGQTTTVSGNRSATRSGAVFIATVTGTVTAGLFTGDTFVYQVIAPATDITLCTLGLGTVSSVYGPVTLAITSA